MAHGWIKPWKVVSSATGQVKWHIKFGLKIWIPMYEPVEKRTKVRGNKTVGYIILSDYKTISYSLVILLTVPYNVDDVCRRDTRNIVVFNLIYLMENMEKEKWNKTVDIVSHAYIKGVTTRQYTSVLRY